MLAKEPQRFQRLVDTLFLEDIIYILCKHSLYKELFKEALDYNYPQGLDEVREFLNRIVPIRNALSHSNPISVRQAEQAICYSNDFIDGLKKYYTQKGLEKMWNVPSIIKVTDSLGNVFYPSDAIARTIFIKDKNGVFRVGDTYKISVEIDPSFEPSSYNVEWNEEYNPKRDDLNDSHEYFKTFTVKDVRQDFIVNVRIISKKDYHKYSSCDDNLQFMFTVLPFEF